MRPGASTPEELESLLEDACLLGDHDAWAELFDAAALLVVDPESTAAHGTEEIVRSARALCRRGFAYLAAPRHVLQTHDTALVVADGATNVLRRADGGGWRYTISLLSIDNPTRGDDR